MLTTLAYRIPYRALDEVLGNVTAYPLTEEFREAWAALPVPRQRCPPYRSLATALSAFADRPVRLFPAYELSEGERAEGTRALLVSDGGLGRLLAPAVRAWEGHVRDGVGEPTLAGFLPEPEPARSLADFVDGRGRLAPTAPSWVFRTAAWRVMSRLCHPLALENGKTLILRKDTDGSLLAWDVNDLIADQRNTMFSMATISVSLTNRRGMKDLVLSFDGHLSKLMRDGGYATNTWVSHHPDKPVLRLPLRWSSETEDGEKTWTPYLDQHLTHVLSTLELAPITLPDSFAGRPGDVRPQAAPNRYHRVGSGLGPRFMARLEEHISAYLPELERLEFKHDRRINLVKRVVKHLKEGLSSADVATSGYDRLTLACIYSTTEARQRMLGEIKAMTGVAVRPMPGGPPVEVNERLFVTAHHAPDLIEHGYRNRAALLEDLGLANATDGEVLSSTLTVAWVETEFHPDVPQAADAKPHLRRIMAHTGIPTQFLATDPPVLPKDSDPRAKEQLGHMARSALRDLMRVSGVVDPRVYRAITNESLREPLDRPAVLVGIHTRNQLSRRGENAPMRVLTMCALVVNPKEPDERRLLAYSERRGTWVRFAEGVADYHSDAVGFAEYGESEERRERLRDMVEARLKILSDVVGSDLPLVLFANAQAARRIWTGISNSAPVTDSERPAQVPGETLRALGRDVAVVRINTAVDEIGRPVKRTDGMNLPRDERQPAAPGRRIYEVIGTTEPTWYFPGRSITSAAAFGDLASQYTRWCDIPDRQQGWKQWRTPWHAFTAAEIVVIHAGSWRPATLAALSARLSDQPLSWDGRTAAPVPLHLAVGLDLDHPDYRAAYEADAEAVEG